MKILVIDNYDSFVFNLVHMLYALGVEHVEVVKNNQFNIEAVAEYDKILLSPGPGIPEEAGLMPEVIKRYASSKSILGVCLGHQAIAESFGGKLLNLGTPLHGVASQIQFSEADYLFDGLPQNFAIGHYHSWVVDAALPPSLKLLAQDAAGNIMAIKHAEFDLRGVQFHPESILTEHGIKIMENWIKR